MAAISLGAIVAVLVASPAALAGPGALAPAAGPASTPVDPSSTLAADGTFLGATGVEGTIDTTTWALVSEPVGDQAPRLARVSAAPGAVSPGATPTGPWSALGTDGNLNGPVDRTVNALAVSGSNLYVGGGFRDAGGVAKADYVAKWNGHAWSALGSDGHGHGALNDNVEALAVSGSNVYVGGHFTNAGGLAKADYIAKWNGPAWSALGSDGHGDWAITYNVVAIAVSGAIVYAGGYFTDAAGIAGADYVAMWNGTTWSALGSATVPALGSYVYALAVVGASVYVGGNFVDAAGIDGADYIARWGGGAWHALGGPSTPALGAYVLALAVSGTELYVGGYFTDAAGIPEADYLARWNGIKTWSAVGSNGAGNGRLTAPPHALAASGTDVYAGGEFVDSAGPRADYIVPWNGSSWSALGSDGNGNGAINGVVIALAASTKYLYVGGDFIDAAGIDHADRIARWTR